MATINTEKHFLPKHTLANGTFKLFLFWQQKLSKPLCDITGEEFLFSFFFEGGRFYFYFFSHSILNSNKILICKMSNRFSISVVWQYVTLCFHSNPKSYTKGKKVDIYCLIYQCRVQLGKESSVDLRFFYSHILVVCHLCWINQRQIFKSNQKLV